MSKKEISLQDKIKSYGNDKIEKEEMSAEELKELEDMFKDYR